MAHPGILIALCAVLLAVDGSAQTAPDTAPASPCRFTLERDAIPAADDDGETWLLTCHHSPAAASLQPVVQRRIVRPAAAPEGVKVSPAL